MNGSSTAIDFSHDDGPGWEQQQQIEESHRWEVEETNGELRASVQAVIDDGAVCFEDIQEGELKTMIARIIRTVSPINAWQFITDAPGAESYPNLLADALASEYGGYLALERTRDRLVKAILSGAIRYARGIIEQIFEEELAKRNKQTQ